MSKAKYSPVGTVRDSVEMRRPPDADINKMYTVVLEQLLTPPTVRDKLIESQTMDQKWKLVQAQLDMFEKNTPWGEKEKALLLQIETAQIPDIKNLNHLKVMLSSANYEFMKSFLEANGVNILMKAIETRISKKSSLLTEIDIAILFEIMLCFKLIMNNSIGMEGFLAVDGCLDTMAKCLNFDYKFFALQVRIDASFYYMCCLSAGILSNID